MDMCMVEDVNRDPRLVENVNRDPATWYMMCPVTPSWTHLVEDDVDDVLSDPLVDEGVLVVT